MTMNMWVASWAIISMIIEMRRCCLQMPTTHIWGREHSPRQYQESCAVQVNARGALQRLNHKSKLLKAIRVCVFLGRWFQGLLLIYLWKFYPLCLWAWIIKPLASSSLYCKVRALSNGLIIAQIYGFPPCQYARSFKPPHF